MKEIINQPVELPAIDIVKKKTIEHNILEEQTISVRGNSLKECLDTIRIIDSSLIRGNKNETTTNE